MSKTITPVNTTDTFQVWLQRTNDLVTELGTSIVTASIAGDTTIGSATLTGSLTSNTVVASSLLRTNAIDNVVGNTSPIEMRGVTTFVSTSQVPVIVNNSLGPRIKIQNNNIGWLMGVRGSAGTGTDAQFVVGVDGSDFAMRIGTDGTIYANNIVLDTESSSPSGVVRASRSIFTANGIIGGGDLTADRTFELTGNALAVHALSANGIVTKTASGSMTTRSIDSGSGITITNGSGVAGNPSVAVDSTVVRTTGSQTILGTKTFYDMTANNVTNQITSTVTSNVSNIITIDKGAGTYGDAVQIRSGTTASGNPHLFIKKASATAFEIGGWNSAAAQGQLSLSFPSGVTISNALSCGGDITSTSDMRLKENIATIGSALDKVSRLRGVYFNKIGESERKLGLIAQEVEGIVPEVVNEDDSGIKSVAYANLVGLLIEAIKELSDRIEKLESGV